MNSFNHYSLGSCGEYLYEYVGGIQSTAPGFKQIRIAPMMGYGLSWANTTFDSIHGRIATKWDRIGDQINLKVTIPANTIATVLLPADDVSQITESGHPLTQATGITVSGQENGNAILTIGSGNYDFTSQAKADSSSVSKN